jgi:hypothetical protein
MRPSWVGTSGRRRPPGVSLLRTLGAASRGYVARPFVVQQCLEMRSIERGDAQGDDAEGELVDRPWNGEQGEDQEPAQGPRQMGFCD